MQISCYMRQVEKLYKNFLKTNSKYKMNLRGNNFLPIVKRLNYSLKSESE